MESELCERCGKNPSSEPHLCPYDEELGSGKELCNCCEECTQECAMDI